MKLAQILERIENARTGEAVKLIAVSKNVTTKEVLELFEQGQTSFGENRVQELKNKSEILSNLPIEWHFIGRLQSNKINHLLALKPALWQSCESVEAALAVDKRLICELPCLLQINSAHEDTKQGISPEVAQECKFLKPIGVMSIGAHAIDERVVQKSFETTRKIYENLQPRGAKICSMGMSGDFELAIKSGSNMIRLGSILYS